MKSCASGGITPFIHNICSRQSWVVRFMSWPLCPGGTATQYPPLGDNGLEALNRRKTFCSTTNRITILRCTTVYIKMSAPYEKYIKNHSRNKQGTTSAGPSRHNRKDIVEHNRCASILRSGGHVSHSITQSVQLDIDCERYSQNKSFTSSRLT
jgi:hypothetical protein